MAGILLADDDVELCEMLTQYLAAEGFAVEAVHDGETALERAGSAASICCARRDDAAQEWFRCAARMRATRRRRCSCSPRATKIRQHHRPGAGADDYLAKPATARAGSTHPRRAAPRRVAST